MANMDFCDKHNMVAFLIKSQQEVRNSIRQCYVRIQSMMKKIDMSQLWEKTIVLLKLLLGDILIADADGISSLPNTEIFEQLTLMGKISTETKNVYGKALTKLVKNVKYLEDKLKSTSVRRKARMVISDDEEDLVLEDPSKQGRMTETEYKDVDISQGEEQRQESSEVQLDVLSAAKILTDASRERVKTYKSYTRRRRSIVSLRDSTAGGCPNCSLVFGLWLLKAYDWKSLSTHQLRLPKLKHQKDHLYSACALGKSKKHSHKPKAEDFIQEKLYLLLMDLCGPIRVQSINRRKYILVIVDDFSQFTWVKFLRANDEVPKFVIKFLKMIQVRLNATVRNIKTDNGTEFVNQTLRDYYEEASLFLWAEAIVTACYTQNRSLIIKRHNKTPYELIHDRKPDLSYLHLFGALCYPTNYGEDLSKLKPKDDIGIFVGYALVKKAFRIYNKRTRMIIETIHFRIHAKLLTPYVPPTKNDWEILFQPMFDKYLNPPPCVDPQVPAVITQEPVVSTGTPSLTIIDQDAPSTSTLQTPPKTPSPVVPLEPSSEESSTQVVIPNHVHSINQPPKHNNKWTKDHPIDNVIAMQEELNEIERLEVWELVHRPDCVMVITVKWIYKVKLDELGDVLKNKARLVARGLQISQSPRGIFLNKSKYALESIKKYGMETCEPADTPMVEKSKLDEDLQGKAVDPTRYRGMIGTLMYLTTSRPDLVFTVCMCARYQTKPAKKHLHA
ncbi:retrovirus-related pol polyprotein from transposon TNT 1-94 [Tanacetum coccineum]|uniref:Retrovirus-related pol polyprotein from transposon TNT 1-94 n=1 Tax=Tanacetum coccineum TaxID=301880 RepID=A0ABQ5A3M4_9ASTR